jgi:ABC-type transport system involved in multi-copper enzyme maturation permease subunit
MEESITIATPEKPTPRPNLFRRALDNPVILKELRSLMRGRRAFLLLTGYIAVISIFIGIIYIFLQTQSSFTQNDPQFRQGVGKTIFGTVVLLELLLVSFIGPALTAGAITAERERLTFDLLRTTLISARSLVFGKLGSALVYLLLLIFSALPIQSLAFLLGGVGLAELVISSLLLVVTALFFSALGLFFSSFLKRTLAATVSSYAAIVLSFLALGMAFFMLIFLNLPNISNNRMAEQALLLALWGMISTNPLLTAIISEVILIDSQSIFYTRSLFGSNNLPLPSPWIPFTILYVTATLLMVILSIHFISRPDRS